MNEDGRLDSQRNSYNVAGVQVANPQKTGDLSIGSSDRDPTGRVISRNLELPVDGSGNAIDGYVLTSDSTDSTHGLGWRAPIAQVSGTPDKLAGFGASGGLETKSNLEQDNKGLTIGATDVSHAQLQIQSNEAGFGNNTLTIKTESSQTGQRFAIVTDPLSGSNTTPQRLLVNGNVALESTEPNHTPINRRVDTVIVRSLNDIAQLEQASGLCLAHFVNGGSHTSVDTNARVISLPSNTLDQIQALPTLLANEFSSLASALGSPPSALHADTSLSMLIDNAIAYCHEDDSYYVYSQSTNQFVKLTTQSDVSAIGAMTAVESAAITVNLSGGQSSDITVTDMFSFGTVMKVKAVGSSSQSSDVNVRLEFYRTSNFANEDYTGQIEIVVKPNQTTYAWASVPVEDDAGTGSIYVKIQNITQTTALTADLQLKGAGV